MKLMYCQKCGRVVLDIKYCDVCKNSLLPVPEKYIDELGIFFKSDEDKQLLIDELVKPSPEFNQYLFDHRDEILKRKNTEFDNKMAIGKALMEGRKVSRRELMVGKLDSKPVCKPTCPYCHSDNVSKIGTVNRLFSTVMFGLGSSKVGKQYHCNSCKSDF